MLGKQNSGHQTVWSLGRNRSSLGDRDSNPDLLIQSQPFCLLNYPRTQEKFYHCVRRCANSRGQAAQRPPRA